MNDTLNTRTDRELVQIITAAKKKLLADKLRDLEEQIKSLSTSEIREFSRVEFNLSKDNVPSGPDDFCLNITGSICIDSEGDDLEVGTVSAIKVFCAEAMENGWGSFDALESPNSATASCLTLMRKYSPLPKLLKKYSALLHDPGPIDTVLLLHKIELNPVVRGHGLGLLSVKNVMDTFGDIFTLAVCRPFPNQFSGGAKESDPHGFERAQRKLQDYWARLGFVKMGNTGLYAVHMESSLPDIQQIMAA